MTTHISLPVDQWVISKEYWRVSDQPWVPDSDNFCGFWHIVRISVLRGYIALSRGITAHQYQPASIKASIGCHSA